MASIGNNSIEGQINLQVTPVSANYTVTVTDDVVQVTTGSSTIAVSLPAPVPAGSFTPGSSDPTGNGNNNTLGSVGNQGQRVTVEKVDTGAGTVVVDGVLPGYIRASGKVTLAHNGSSVTFVSDGTFWNCLGTVS